MKLLQEKRVHVTGYINAHGTRTSAHFRLLQAMKSLASKDSDTDSVFMPNGMTVRKDHGAYTFETPTGDKLGSYPGADPPDAVAKAAAAQDEKFGRDRTGTTAAAKAQAADVEKRNAEIGKQRADRKANFAKGATDLPHDPEKPGKAGKSSPQDKADYSGELRTRGNAEIDVLINRGGQKGEAAKAEKARRQGSKDSIAKAKASGDPIALGKAVSAAKASARGGGKGGHEQMTPDDAMKNLKNGAKVKDPRTGKIYTVIKDPLDSGIPGSTHDYIVDGNGRPAGNEVIRGLRGTDGKLDVVSAPGTLYGGKGVKAGDRPDLPGKGDSAQRKYESAKGGSQKRQDLVYLSDDELKTVVKTGTGERKEQADQILKDRGKADPTPSQKGRQASFDRKKALTADKLEVNRKIRGDRRAGENTDRLLNRKGGDDRVSPKDAANLPVGSRVSDKKGVTYTVADRGGDKVLVTGDGKLRVFPQALRSRTENGGLKVESRGSSGKVEGKGRMERIPDWSPDTPITPEQGKARRATLDAVRKRRSGSGGEGKPDDDYGNASVKSLTSKADGGDSKAATELHNRRARAKGGSASAESERKARAAVDRAGTTDEQMKKMKVDQLADFARKGAPATAPRAKDELRRRGFKDPDKYARGLEKSAARKDSVRKVDDAAGLAYIGSQSTEDLEQMAKGSGRAAQAAKRELAKRRGAKSASA